MCGGLWRSRARKAAGAELGTQPLEAKRDAEAQSPWALPFMPVVVLLSGSVCCQCDFSDGDTGEKIL